MGALEDKEGGVELQVRVQPRASRNALRLEPDGRIRVAVTAPPVDDAANAAVIAYFARLLGIPKSRIQLIRGLRSREKTILFRGLATSQVQASIKTD